MRRIRSGENQLGFFGRIGRVLSTVLEPGFVLPASAIAAAALVVTVVQGLGVGASSDVARDEQRSSIGRAESSVASLLSSSEGTRRGGRTRVSRANGASNGMDFVARVQRRATQTDRTLQASRDPRLAPATARSGTRIRIKLRGLGLARESRSQRSTQRTPQIAQRSMSSGGPVRTSQMPDTWTTDFSRIMSGNTSEVASRGTLVAAERLGAGDFMTRFGVWPQTIAPGEFTTGADSSTDSSTDNSRGRTAERDPRDAWLALGFEDPAEFARYIAGRNLAEQELWAARLSERAEARGVLGEFLQVLRESGDPIAAWVADDFSAQAERASHGSSEAGDPLNR
jgi:hypothetical protein